MHRPTTATLAAAIGLVPALALTLAPAIALITACPAGAGTIRVPADQPSVRAGLAASAAGDTVLVAPGTWAERDLVLVSGVVLLGETGDPADVVLDAGGAGRCASAVSLGPATEVRGVTLRNGSTSSHGAGIYVANTDLRVLDCRIETCTAGNWGGGMAFQGTSSPVIERCVFSGNTSQYGGGIYCELGAPVVTECRFENNTASFGGGGMQAWYSPSTPTVTDCVFLGNRSSSFAGGAFSVQYGTAVLTGCTIAQNRAGSAGTGVHVHQGGSLTLDRCIVAFQTGLPDPVACEGGAALTITCSDVFGNSAGDWIGCIAGLDSTGGNFAADPGFCDVANGDVTLQGNSPCAPGASPCGQIGAAGVGCGAGATSTAASLQAVSWGSVKAHYREETPWKP